MFENEKEEVVITCLTKKTMTRDMFDPDNENEFEPIENLCQGSIDNGNTDPEDYDEMEMYVTPKAIMGYCFNKNINLDYDVRNRVLIVTDTEKAKAFKYQTDGSTTDIAYKIIDFILKNEA